MIAIVIERQAFYNRPNILMKRFRMTAKEILKAEIENLDEADIKEPKDMLLDGEANVWHLLKHATNI